MYKPVVVKFISIAFILLISILSAAPAQNLSPVNPGDLVFQGFSEKVSGTSFSYHSAISDINQCYLVRAIDGKQKATWLTEIPSSLEAKGKVHFVWMAGLGSNLGNIPMTLKVNDKYSCTFQTSRKESWDLEFGNGFTLSFRNAFTDGAGDLFGFMFLTGDPKHFEAGKPVKLEVTGSASNSQAWYMTFTQAIKQGLSFTTYPALYEIEEKQYQPVVARILYFGTPCDASLMMNGKTIEDFEMQFGIQQRKIDIAKVTKTRNIEFAIKSKSLSDKKMLRLDPVRPWEVWFVQHSHTDIGYTRPQTEVLAEHQRYIDYALDFCDATDDYPKEAQFKWTCEASYFVEAYLKNRPESQIERLLKRIQEGRIEVTGMYFNFDEMPDEQTYAASLQSLATFQSRGIQVKTAMQNDVNGIGWCFADYFPESGVTYLNMGTHGHRALIPFDLPTAFWWESPSGNKMLSFRAEHYMTGNTVMGIHTADFPYFEGKVMEYLTRLGSKGYPYQVIPIQHSGYQTDNSPPSTISSDMVKAWNDAYVWPKLKTATVSEFFQYLESNHSSDLSVIRGAWPDWWTDGYGSAAREVAASRQSHTDIIASQGGLSMAMMLGSDLPVGINDRIDLANEALLFYDEHTFGHAQSVTDPLFEGTMDQRSLKESYAWEAFRRSRMILEEAMGLLQQYIARNEDHPTLTLFNTLNWSRSGIALVYIDHQILPMGVDFSIVDAHGKKMKAQAMEHRSDGTYWAIHTDNIPAMGYTTYSIILNPSGTETSPNKRQEKSINQISQNLSIENEWYKLEIETNTATILSLFDKQLEMELCDPMAPWKLGQMVHETLGNRSQMEAFTLTDFERNAPDTIWLEAHEEGPVWTTIRFKGESASTVGPGGIEIEIRLYKTQKQLELVYQLRKKAVTDPEAIYIAFPFTLKEGAIFAEVQGGIMKAGVDQIPGSANDWNSVQNFASVRNSQAQIVLSSHKIPLMQFGNINTGRYQAGAIPESTHIYGWPMNNYWTTNFNADQRGEFTFSYVITSGPDPSDLFATRFGWSHRIPLLSRVSPPGAHTGQPESVSLWKGFPENLLLINAKPVGKDESIVLHLREISGSETRIPSKLVVNGQTWFLSRTDVLGNLINDNTGDIGIAPHASLFVRMERQR